MKIYIFPIILATLIVGILIVLNYIKNKGKLELMSLGWVQTPSGMRNLQHYYLDKKGDLYSTNPLTWENRPKRGNFLKCSDNAVDKQGNIVNSLRTTMGTKVTLRRKDIIKHRDLLVNSGYEYDEYKIDRTNGRNMTLDLVID
ncbi:MAG: hypothetical protein Unbinned200contig1002_30 [Prokaryotic dsDNA virus sp.]|jgi:hypothetical protein|nr:hypothetical protein [Flavobacteriaceae bacterium]QDP68329.1 MAG: hypothetical protein Unbinned200contig1002_30 [Prokaryotic dsDNA virus sp.]|tara:strand:- start:79 stop:507 length:429 start_codon:yes stop_codon:yes gene_type:complete